MKINTAIAEKIMNDEELRKIAVLLREARSGVDHDEDKVFSLKQSLIKGLKKYTGVDERDLMRWTKDGKLMYEAYIDLMLKLIKLGGCHV